MRRIILFAFVYVAFSQVHGAIEDEIKVAIENLDIMEDAYKKHIQNVKDNYDSMKTLLASRTDIYIQTQAEFTQAAISETKNVSADLIKKAKESKLPQDVINCITKETEATVSAISAVSTKYKTDIKGMLKSKMTVHEQQGKEIKKIEDSVKDRYKKGVAELKKCKTSECIPDILLRLQDEYIKTMNDLQKIEVKMTLNRLDYEKDVRVLTANSNVAVTLKKNTGLKNMKACMPKMA